MEELILNTLIDQYGLVDIKLKKLVAYDITNYQVTGRDATYILKIYKIDTTNLSRIEAENDVLRALANHDDSFPSPIGDIKGADLHLIKKDNLAFRLLTYLDGELLVEHKLTVSLVAELGSFLATMDKDLLNYRDPYIEQTRTEWDLEHFLDNQRYLDYITDPADNKLVSYFILQWKTYVIEQLSSFRRSTIHNDANDWNVLVQDGKISGIIDFGDVVFSRLIYEIAVACAYLVMNEEDPIETIGVLLSSYHMILPLEEREVDILYYLIAGRLCTTLLHSAKAKTENPNNKYITVSEKGAWKLLNKWITINPLKARMRWRSAINCPLPADKDVSIERRNQTIPSVLSLSYEEPIHMTGGAAQYMYDIHGNAYLDAYNNIIHVGHCHPHVVEAGQKAMARLNTNTRYLYDSLLDYSEQLLKYFPDPLDKVFLVNSGSAASDLAVRLARTHTTRHKMIVLEHGYHGNTSEAIHLSHYKYSSDGGQGKPDHIIQAVLPDIYRGKYQGEDAGELYASELLTQLKRIVNGRNREKDIAAFMAEPIVGCAGQVLLAKGYLKKVYQDVRSLGGVCISDEVQTGFGRMGSCFWGYELHDVVPDIVILGKPIGNGHPMAAVVTTSAIANSFDNGMEFFSSFGGNPVSCAIGNAVLEVIEKEGLQKQTHMVGTWLKEELSSLATVHKCIGDVRGEGLFLGVDIVEDQISKKADGAKAKYLINHLKDQYILTSLDGPGLNVIKIKPPLCFDQNNAERLIGAFRKALMIS